MNPKFTLTIPLVLNLFFNNWNIMIVQNDHIIFQGELEEVRDNYFVINNRKFYNYEIINIQPSCYKNSIFINIE